MACKEFATVATLQEAKPRSGSVDIFVVPSHWIVAGTHLYFPKARTVKLTALIQLGSDAALPDKDFDVFAVSVLGKFKDYKSASELVEKVLSAGSDTNMGVLTDLQVRQKGINEKAKGSFYIHSHHILHKLCIICLITMNNNTKYYVFFSKKKAITGKQKMCDGCELHTSFWTIEIPIIGSEPS